MATITRGSRARDLFVNREELIYEFSRRLNEDPPADSILCLTGEGGIGKSLLIDILNERYCRRLIPRNRHSPLLLDDPWPRLASLNGPDFIRALLESESEPIPAAYVDFASAGAELDRPLDAFSCLQSIRRQLLKSGSEKLYTPVFQYGAIQYLLRTKQLNERWCAKLFPAAEADLVSSILDHLNAGGWLIGAGATLFTGATASVSIPAAAILKGLWGIAAGQMKQPVTVWLAARKTPEEDIQEIDRMKDGELLEYLPELFARDLNASMASQDEPKRIALLFDSHERFWGSDRTRLSPFDLAARDAWLRNFITSLDLTRGATVVIGGQEPPRWAEAGFDAPPMDVRRVDYLKTRPAGEYLTRADVPPAEQAELLQKARVEDGVQPFYLGLLVDAYRLESKAPSHTVARERGGDPFQQVVMRLEAAVGLDLRSAIRALSACLSFDLPLFRLLGAKLGFAATRDQFDVLVSLSFVRTAGDGQYRIHDLLRRFYKDDDEVKAAHEVLREHYESLAGESGAAGARFVYHWNQIDAPTGLDAWHARFEAALALSRSEACESLLRVVSELRKNGSTDEGRLSYAAASFYARYSRYTAAEAEFRAAIRSFQQEDDHDSLHLWLGLATADLADLEAQLSRYDDALASYGQAIQEYERVLGRAPDSFEARNNKGITLQSRANLEAQLSRHEAALASYGQAIQEYDLALGRAPDYVEVRNNRGNALQSQADLEAQLSRHEAALASYGLAIQEFDLALGRAPEDVEVRNNKGNALQRRANLEAQLSRHKAALASYGQAIEEYDLALGRAPDYVLARSNKGTTLQRRADLEAQLSRHKAALASYGQAIEEYDLALGRTPDHVEVRNNKGNALQRRANLEAQLSRHKAALVSYGQAIEEYDLALGRTPNHIEVRNNKGLALQRRADLEAQLSRHEAALKSYRLAIEEYDLTLGRAPDYVLARSNKGITLQRRADLESQLSRRGAALESNRLAIQEFDLALGRAPDHVEVRNNKGLALQRRADLETQLSQHDDALTSYGQAIEEFERALRHAPNYVEARNNKGITLQHRADLEAQLSRYDDALASCGLSIQEYERALKVAPNGRSFHGRCIAWVTFAALAEEPERLDLALADLSAWEALKDGSEEEINRLRSSIESLRRVDPPES